MTENTKPRTEWVKRVQELVKKWKECVSDKLNSDILPMLPERICRELTDYLPSDVILVSDPGTLGFGPGP